MPTSHYILCTSWISFCHKKGYQSYQRWYRYCTHLEQHGHKNSQINGNTVQVIYMSLMSQSKNQCTYTFICHTVWEFLQDISKKVFVKINKRAKLCIAHDRQIHKICFIISWSLRLGNILSFLAWEQRYHYSLIRDVVGS